MNEFDYSWESTVQFDKKTTKFEEPKVFFDNICTYVAWTFKVTILYKKKQEMAIFVKQDIFF